MLTEGLPCMRHCSKCLTLINFFNHHSSIRERYINRYIRENIFIDIPIYR